MIVGGTYAWNDVELVSLDLDNPVPPCLSHLNNFPGGIIGAAGSIGEGMITHIS